MSVRLPASAEPRRTCGGAGGARPNRPGRRSQQTVWIAESMFRGDHYPDEFLTVYTKVAALDARRTWPGHRAEDDGCTASVSELAAMCGLSKSGAERGLKAGHQPGPAGSEQWIGTRRRTHKGGTGRTAERYARLVPDDEPALQVPVAAADALSPRRFRAYLHLLRATTLRLPVTGAELAGELHHQSGENAGQPLGEKTGRRLLAELDAAGWITLGHRTGRQGRHTVTVNPHPILRAVLPTAEQLSLPLGTDTALSAPRTERTDTTDGSGPDDHGGSLASKEDSSTSTDRSSQLTWGIRRRRGAGKWVPAPVENLGAVPAVLRSGHHQKRSNNGGGRAYDGPDLTMSERVWEALAPVHHAFWRASVWEQRKIGREIGRQLTAGATPERLAARLQSRYASTEEPYRGENGIGRWILGAGLHSKGCGLASCEDGTTWPTAERCPVCLDNATAQAEETRRLEEAERAQRRWAERTAAWAQRQEQQRAAATKAEAEPCIPPPARVTPRPADPFPHQSLTPDQRAVLRASATTESVRAAITAHGQTRALYLYGHALVLPHLNSPDPYGLEGEARAQ